jgi:hypothetical protein
MTASGERLLQTSRAKHWLNQFDPRDRGAAELLVRSLILVSTDEVETALAGLIRHRRAEVVNDPLRPSEAQAPIALYAMREIDRYCEVPVGTRRLRHGCNVLTRSQLNATPRQAGSTWLPLYFDSCERDASASPVGLKEVGSEGSLAFLIKRLCRRKPGQAPEFIGHPSLDKLRLNKCREVFLVDDLIGSGERAESFIAAFCRHPTIASWLSGQFLRVSVIAFAASQWGVARARKARPQVSAVHYEHDVLSGRHCLPEDGQEILIDLCRRYGKRTGSPRMALGFGSAEDEPHGLCTMVFAYKCPNNAPAILWAGKEGQWMPLFERLPSQGVLECFHGGGNDARRAVLFALLSALEGQHRLGMEAVNLRTGLGLSVCQRRIEWCQVNGLVDDRLRLTAAGRRELRHFRQREAAAQRQTAARDRMLDDGEPFYYPSELRAARADV